MRDKVIKGISVNVLLLGVISFLNDISSEMIMPILPMFIASLGGTGLIIGLVGGIRDSISSILKIFSGYLSDKTGRRKIFVFSGYLTSAVFKILLAFSKIWQHILIFASLERLGKGIRTASIDAIIADSMPSHRGKGFGVHKAFDTTGAIFGSVIVFILFWFLNFDFKTIILIAALIAFISLIPVYFIKERKRKQQAITLKIELKDMPKPLKLFIFISAVFALANFSYMFFILKAQQAFIGKFSIGLPILLYILFNIFYAGFAIPFGELSDKIGRKKVLVSGYLIFSLTAMGFAIFNTLTAFIILFALYGISYALINANQRAFVSDLSAKGSRATALGTFHTVIGLVTLPASLIAGLLWQITPWITFIYATVMGLVSVMFFSIFKAHFNN